MGKVIEFPAPAFRACFGGQRRRVPAWPRALQDAKFAVATAEGLRRDGAAHAPDRPITLKVIEFFLGHRTQTICS